MAARPAPALDAAETAALGALEGHGLIALCSRCRRRSAGTHAGRATLCYPCTVTEIGMDLNENAWRIEAGKSVRAWLANPITDPARLPRMTAFRRRIGR